MATYFISDLHLNQNSTENSSLLLEFLHGPAASADALYILGDLFAVWFGDDLQDHYVLNLIAALRNLTAKKIPVYLMHGNRDFLIGHKFCEAAGIKLLPDPYITNIYGKSVLITHGDQLCTLDPNYQRFRKFVQHPLIKKLFLALPTWLRIKIGNWVRIKAMSKPNIAADYDAKMHDVDPSTVKEWLEQYQVQVMIHGHTHLPAVHDLGDAKRIVLGDWTNKSAKILECKDGDFTLQDLRKATIATV